MLISNTNSGTLIQKMSKIGWCLSTVPFQFSVIQRQLKVKIHSFFFNHNQSDQSSREIMSPLPRKLVFTNCSLHDFFRFDRFGDWVNDHEIQSLLLFACCLHFNPIRNGLFLFQSGNFLWTYK